MTHLLALCGRVDWLLVELDPWSQTHTCTHNRSAHSVSYGREQRTRKGKVDINKHNAEEDSVKR
eukprot:SAG22_NODE_790_length_7216_cov_5.198820_7_plen_64_part_00